MIENENSNYEKIKQIYSECIILLEEIKKNDERRDNGNNI